MMPQLTTQSSGMQDHKESTRMALLNTSCTGSPTSEYRVSSLKDKTTPLSKLLSGECMLTWWVAPFKITFRIGHIPYLCLELHTDRNTKIVSGLQRKYWSTCTYGKIKARNTNRKNPGSSTAKVGAISFHREHRSTNLNIPMVQSTGRGTRNFKKQDRHSKPIVEQYAETK